MGFQLPNLPVNVEPNPSQINAAYSDENGRDEVGELHTTNHQLSDILLACLKLSLNPVHLEQSTQGLVHRAQALRRGDVLRLALKVNEGGGC